MNHALGVISLDALEYGRDWFLLLWRNLIGAILLYGALLAHMLLALWVIYQRRSFRLRAVEWAQLLLGLCIPVLLIGHALNTRLAYQLFGQDDSYHLELAIFFILKPELIYQQMLLVLVVWGHGCIGLHQWLRLKPSYRRVQWLAYAVALLLPGAALAGTWVAGRDIINLASQSDWLDQQRLQDNQINNDQLEYLSSLENGFLGLAALALLAVVLLRPLRRMLRRRRGLVRVTYPDGAQINVLRGTTILEASRIHQISHASVCGGRGRCSTCRVRVVQGLETLPPLSVEEARILERIGADRSVRLACQTRPDRDCSVVPLLNQGTNVRSIGVESPELVGQERQIIVVFVDLREFTTLSEQKLPYDVVFILNNYFAAMGSAITMSGGYVDKFIGDGVMALFGLKSGPQEASRAALKSAYLMAGELTKLNQTFEHDLPKPLRLGIGIHCGPAIVGTMGYGETSSLTAVGDTVNTASRLEGVTKSLDVQLVFSEVVAEMADLPTDLLETKEIELRGRQNRMLTYIVPDASNLKILSWIK
ncbi:MAG: adenylate/guanylate cyclase domain-containing protein [Granulosicoccus sp.]|nr:adenylate/guanylate cyclase domain-containing protein [Granulosicoccus sp.]